MPRGTGVLFRVQISLTGSVVEGIQQGKEGANGKDPSVLVECSVHGWRL